jgi:dolichyl-phosphate-mannose-protein mannosyltransferase
MDGFPGESSSVQPVWWSADRVVQDRRWRRAVIGFVLAAVIANGGWLMTHPPGPLSGETPHWWPIVLNVAGGKGYVGCFPEYFPSCSGIPDWPTATREPLPVLLFAVVAKVLGSSLLAASMAEGALNVLVLLALLFLAREFKGEGTALLAGLLWLSYLPALKLIPQVSGELLATLGLVCALFWFLRGRRTGRNAWFFVSGLALGAAGLSRSSSLAVGPVLVGISLFLPAVGFRRRLAGAAAVVLGILIPLAPWVARNFTVFGKPVMGSTLVGYNLYRQNYQLPMPDYLRFVAGPEAGQALEELRRRRPALATAGNEAALEEVYREEAEKVILENPGRYAALSGYRFLLLWFGWGYLQAYGKNPEPADFLVMAEQAALLILALLGLRHTTSKASCLALSVAMVCLVHMAVISQLRFIVPVMPLAMTLSAAGLLALTPWRRGLPVEPQAASPPG